MGIKNLPLYERPREKALARGVEELSDSELLAIILGEGNRQMSSLELATTLIINYKGLHAFSKLLIGELMLNKGIKAAKSISIFAAIEFGKRVFLATDNNNVKVTSSQDIYEKFGRKLGNDTSEKLMLLTVNSKMEVSSSTILSQGDYVSTQVSPQKIFEIVIKSGVNRFILIHNHPMGDAYPSLDDGRTTETIAQLSKLFKIQLYDHIIVSAKSFYSFRDAGRLQNGEKNNI